MVGELRLRGYITARRHPMLGNDGVFPVRDTLLLYIRQPLLL